MGPRLIALVLLVAGLILPGTYATAQNAPVEPRIFERHMPDDGVLFGINSDWKMERIPEVNQHLGATAGAYGRFLPFPASKDDLKGLDVFASDVNKVDGIMILTLEPSLPLAAITREDAEELASTLASYNEDGVAILLRFAPEMNGTWHPWGQQPVAYVAAFQIVADAVHATAPDTAMLWSPNYGGGYPFGGPHQTPSGSEDFLALDTDNDGELTLADDPYAPYYPGDDAVDWVGMTNFHWGGTYPWGENAVPEPGKFVFQVRGTYVGANGDESALPDFYGTYVEATGKPFTVLTSALVNAENSSSDENVLIKQGWWRQVFGAAADELPALQLVEWFEWEKEEPEAANTMIDWTLTTNDQVISALKADADSLHIVFGPSVPVDEE